jgi:putative transposase
MEEPMARKRYTEEQIIAILKESEAGKKAPEICRDHGISPNTFYAWKAKYSGMTVSDVKKLKALEEENRKLKHIVADQALDIRALKEISSKNW